MKPYILMILAKIPVLKFLAETFGCQTAVSLCHLWKCIYKSKIYLLVYSSSLIFTPDKIVVVIDVSAGYMLGCCIQGGDGILIIPGAAFSKYRARELKL